MKLTGFFLMPYSPWFATDGLYNSKQCAEIKKAATQSQETRIQN